MKENKKKIKRSEDEVRNILADRTNGRDEMNLAELPIFALSSRVARDVHVLEFEFEEFDKKLQQPVRRHLTVTGDPKVGLPTAAAEEVNLALFHHTHAWNDFRDPHVFFCRGELLKTLGWSSNNLSYHRLTKCMDQLSGVRLKCTNLWRDNRAKEYRTTENISVVDYYRW